VATCVLVSVLVVSKGCTDLSSRMESMYRGVYIVIVLLPKWNVLASKCSISIEAERQTVDPLFEYVSHVNRASILVSFKIKKSITK
jgi:hypothetical protein